jgi:hypothetical protein
MKKFFVLVLTLMGSGCLQIPQRPTEDSPPAALLPLGKSLGPDHVTPQNAHALSQALWDELDRDGQRPGKDAARK